MQETPWIKYKFGREFQAILQDRLEYLFYSCLGPENPTVYQSDLYFRKGVFTWVRNNAFKLYNKLTKREFPKDRPKIETFSLPTSEIETKEYDDWLYNYLNTDWNPVYEELKETGTLLGALSAYLTGNYNLPEETVQNMGIEDVDRALKHKTGTGLIDIDDLYPKLEIEKSMQYAREYAQRDAAIHLAVYDENGERKGRAYEIITQSYRQMISEAIDEGKTVSEIQSRIAYPNLRDYLENGKISLEEYNEWMNDKMNRNFNRIAITEASYAFNFGRMRQLAESGRTYLKFMPG